MADGGTLTVAARAALDAEDEFAHGDLLTLRPVHRGKHRANRLHSKFDRRARSTNILDSNPDERFRKPAPTAAEIVLDD